MTDTKPRKRTEELAIENVKRIADVLRAERNDAIGLAQVKREQADSYRKLLEKIQQALSDASCNCDGTAKEIIKACREEITITLAEQ